MPNRQIIQLEQGTKLKEFHFNETISNKKSVKNENKEFQEKKMQIYFHDTPL